MNPVKLTGFADSKDCISQISWVFKKLRCKIIILLTQLVAGDPLILIVIFSIQQVDWGGGGIMSIWDPLVFRKTHSLRSRYFIATSRIWIGVPGVTTIVNVYGPKSVTDKRRVWEELLELKRGQDRLWIFLGDFNTVRTLYE